MVYDGKKWILSDQNETIEDLKLTLDFIKRHWSEMSHLNLNITTPLPGTELWDYAKSKGLVGDEKTNFTRLTISSKQDLANNLYMGDVPFNRFLEIYKEFKYYSDLVNIPRFTDIHHVVCVQKIIEAVKHPKKAINYLLDTIRREMKEVMDEN